MQVNKKEQIHRELVIVNQQFNKLFQDFTYRTDILTKKHTAFLKSQIFGCLGQGTTQVKNHTRESFLICVRGYILDFFHGNILQAFKECRNDVSITTCLIEKWQALKKFTFYYFTLFENANHYYETAYKAFLSQGKSNKIDSNDSIFPIPTIAVFYFKTYVFERYKISIQKEVLRLFAEERNDKVIERDSLRSLCEIFYSCGMGELARIRVVKQINNQRTFKFYACDQKQIVKQYSNQIKNPEKAMHDNILDKIGIDAILFYKNFFQEKISNLSPFEDFQSVSQILQKQSARSQYFLCSEKQIQFYQYEIVRQIVIRNLQERLTKENSFKTYLQKFVYSSDAYLPQIKTFMKPIFDLKWNSIKIVQEIIQKHLLETGSRITEKITKRKQYILEVISLKKSINRIIEETMNKSLNICLIRDKCFKKILDSVEASRNLAEFADWKIKQCIKGKMNDEQIGENLWDVLLILQNLVATDSFLIYHQEMMGKRLIDSLNDPRVDIETILLKKMAEKIGTVTVASHFNMIKDIENSQEISERINKLLPFSKFRWGLRVLSTNFWPDNANRNKIQIQLPEAVRMQAETIANIFHEQNGHKYLNWKLDRGFSLFQGRFETGKFRFQSENVFIMLLFHISESLKHQILFGNLLQKIEKRSEGDTEYVMKCIGVLIQNGLVTRDIPDINAPFTEGQSIKINLKYKPSTPVKPNQTIMIKISPEMHKAMFQTTVQHGKVMKERQKIVEAVLVKLLKHSHSTGTNSMTFEQLYKGICEDNYLKKFTFSQSVVKQRLQQLIARAFCERNENDRKVYHYIA